MVAELTILFKKNGFVFDTAMYNNNLQNKTFSSIPLSRFPLNAQIEKNDWFDWKTEKFFVFVSETILSFPRGHPSDWRILAKTRNKSCLCFWSDSNILRNIIKKTTKEINSVENKILLKKTDLFLFEVKTTNWQNKMGITHFVNNHLIKISKDDQKMSNFAKSILLFGVIDMVLPFES